jgi:hypothetical protein
MDDMLTVSRDGAGSFTRKVSRVAVVPASELSRNVSV